MKMHLRRWTAAVGVLGALALVGAGVSSSLTDSGTATEHVSVVGTFGCSLSSTDSNAVISPDGHTLTVNLPPILSSTAGSSYAQDLTVKNLGSGPIVVHWTEATGGTLAANQWQPSGAFGYTIGPSGNLLSTDLSLASLGTHTYTSLGFQWAALDNSYLGKTASVAYTANCGEPPASHISLVGSSDALVGSGTAKKANSVACPAGTVGGYPWISSHNTTVAQPNGQSTLGSNLITNISSMTGIAVGQTVQSGTAWPTSPPLATVIAAGPGSQVTVSQNAIGTNYGNVMFGVEGQWCGNNTFPVSAALTGWPTSGSFTVTASGGAATVTYTGVQSSPYNAFTGLTSSGTGSVTPGTNNVVQVLAPTVLAMPSGWAVGDVALVTNVGTGAAVPTGYTAVGGNGTYGPSKVGYKVLGSGDGSISVAAGKGVSVSVAVYRGVAGIGASTWAGDPGSVALAVPALTLTNTTGSSWVVGLFGSASANVNAMTLTGMTSRSGSFVGPRDGIYDTNKGVSTWPGATGGPVAQGDEWAVELLSK